MPDMVKPAEVSAISPERVERAIQARYSPLPELTMPILASQLNQFRVGELRQAARTWEIMMERDGDLAVPADKLFADIARLDWEIEREDDSAEADADAEVLEYFYTHLTATSVLEQDESGGINLLLRQLMTAHAYRYSVHEILLQINDAGKKQVTAEFRHVPVWFFGARRGRLEYLPSDGAIYGEALERGKWLAAVGRGMMRQCSVAYLTKWGPLADAMFYSKRFGIPAIHGETSAAPNTPEWNDFSAALQAFANGWILQTSGLGSHKINLVEASKGGSSSLPFKELIERADRVYARCFRGGDLSTQSREGTDVGGANPQESEKRIVLEDGGVWVTEVLNARVDEPLIEYVFKRAPKAWMCVRPPKATDTTKEINALKAARELNIPVSIETARDRLQLPEPGEGEELIAQPEPEPAATDPTERGSASRSNTEDDEEEVIANADEIKTRIAAAIAQKVDPFAELLKRIVAMENDAAMMNALQQLVGNSDALIRFAKADNLRLQQAIEAMTLPELAKGLKK